MAQGTLTRPGALSAGASAALWTPAIMVDSTVKLRVGIDAIHAPSETGVEGAFAGLSLRTGAATLSVGYGRMGISDVTFTETSPEAVAGVIPIWSQSASLGVAFEPRPGLIAGTALRVLSGRLGPASRSQLGLDLGAQYHLLPHLRFGFATQFMDPAFGASAKGAVYSLGGQWVSTPFPAWDSQGTLAFRYGLQLQQGEAGQQLLIGSLSIGRLEVDWGAAHESAYGTGLWRSRFGIGLGAGSYRVEIGRDGGVSGFGATWRFGLTGDFK